MVRYTDLVLGCSRSVAPSWVSNRGSWLTGVVNTMPLGDGQRGDPTGTPGLIRPLADVPVTRG